MENDEIIKEIHALMKFLNLYRFRNNVLQNYNCDFQVQLEEMLDRFKQ